MNLEPSNYAVPRGHPPCQHRCCGHEAWEHRWEDGDYHECDVLIRKPGTDEFRQCACAIYREEPLERDEYEPYDY